MNAATDLLDTIALDESRIVLLSRLQAELTKRAHALWHREIAQLIWLHLEENAGGMLYRTLQNQILCLVQSQKTCPRKFAKESRGIGWCHLTNRALSEKEHFTKRAEDFSESIPQYLIRA